MCTNSELWCDSCATMGMKTAILSLCVLALCLVGCSSTSLTYGVNPARNSITTSPTSTNHVQNIIIEPPGKEWVYVNRGIQCETPDYNTLNDACSQLRRKGIKVYSSKEVQMFCCHACGCWSCTGYAAQIAQKDLAKARSIDWMVYDP